MGQAEAARATLKGFDSIIWGHVFKNPVQSFLFFGETAFFAPPRPQHTHPRHAQHAPSLLRFHSFSFPPGTRTLSSISH